jgi:predicted dehydrogenase
MNTPAHLNWGFLSTARINSALIPPLRTSPRNHLLAVASRNLEKAQTYAVKYSIARPYGSYQELLEDPEIDVIYNPLPNHLHKEWTVRALQAGKHVLCEKPFVLTMAEMDEVIATVQQTGRIATEAFMYRSHIQTIRVREMVTSGSLGDVRLIKGSFTFFMRNESDYRWDPTMGGGGLWDVGCYPVSYARTIYGTEPVEAFAWQKKSSSGVDATLVGMLRFPGDVYLHFDCGIEAVYRAEIEIAGNEASLRIPRPFNPGPYSIVYRTDHGNNPQAVEIRGNELYVDEIEDLADAVLNGKSPIVSLVDTKANTRALLALLESAETGKPVLI